MQYSQKYTLVSFFEPTEIRTEFAMTDWPPHITLADVFAAELDTGIEHKLEAMLADQPSITLSATGDSVLGATEVVLIERNNVLQKLHGQIVDLLELHGAKFNSPEFTRSGFLPHSTIQKSGRLHEGDKIEINTVFLIDMFPDKNWQQRRVLKKFKLGGEKS
ncbi:MAG: hypothetical protein QG649_578 [Patescibacteria group bacterium]|jgi:hypothetical protein|nr:hypothetical protein [Patescibacteria group bacterium]